VRELRRVRDIPVSGITGVDGVSERMDYDFRGANDVVVSGPLLDRIRNPDKPGPGRIFSNKEAAYQWAREKYGENNVIPLRPDEETPRWAVLVKNLRSQ
jgi:hypothetical protein